VILPVVIYADAGAKGTPLMMLAGGPGESAIAVVQQALLKSSLGQMLLRERPIIAFDRRGISSNEGRSTPDLGTIDHMTRMPRARAILALRDSVLSHVRQLKAEGVDPRNFTTLANVEDMADVMKALDLKKVVLMGASYGTRDALQFMRRHPAMVESAILDGVAPPNETSLLDSARIVANGSEVVAHVIADCGKDPACAMEYADLPDILARIAPDSAPLRRTAHFMTGGGWKTISVSRQSMLQVLGIASSSEIVRAEVPRLLVELANSDTLRTELAAGILAVASGDASVLPERTQRIPLIRFVTLCGDHPQGEPFARDRTMCEALSVPFAGADEITPVSSDIPTLLLSSGNDTQTPTALAAEAARTLSHSYHVIFPTIGHVAFAHTVAMACTAVVVESFLVRPDRAPATDCVGSILPAFTPRRIISRQSAAGSQ
jgi:pimeloyl-ACP methyl ester carboxylesterase